MSACDQRAYYQTTNGLFKLRASDGDLMWESRPVSMADPGLETYYNLPVDLVGGHVVYCGVDGGTLKARIARQSGGLVTDVLETDSPGYLVNRSLGGGYNTDGTHIYLTGTTGFNPTVQWTANKYDLLGNHVDGGERFFGTTSFEQPGGRHSLPAADEFVLHFTTPNQVLRKYTGYVASHVAESSPINTALWDTRRHTLLFDGSDYYVTRRSGGVYRMLKVSVGALADGTTSAVIPAAELPFAGAISDGVMATYSGGINTIAEWDTAALTQTWSVSGAIARVMDVDCCDSFVVAAGLTSTSFPATHAEVIRLDAGSVSWSREFRRSATNIPASTDVEIVRARISADQTRVYVFGPMANEPFASLGLRPSIYCLDATDGSIIWMFSGGPNVGSLGDGGPGVSLYDDGDHLYLGTMRCRSPIYR